jgi:hypothetical protein
MRVKAKPMQNKKVRFKREKLLAAQEPYAALYKPLPNFP